MIKIGNSMTTGVDIVVLVASSIANRESGRNILQTILDVAPQYSPERYNNCEPIKHSFDSDELDTALELWEDPPFLWRRRRLLGSADFGWKGTHNSVRFSMSTKAFDLDPTLRLFQELDSRFEIALAHIHIHNDADTEDIEHYKAHIMPFRCLTTHDLREGLPGLSWAMWFGEPYRQLFGHRLLDVPAFSVQKIGNGVYVQLTESPTDVDKQRDAYLAAQAAAQEHLDSDAFRGNPSGKCRVPEFRVPRP